VNIDKRINRLVLRPLRRRRRHSVGEKAVREALERLDQRASGEALLPGVVEELERARRQPVPTSHKDPKFVGRSIAIARALFAARRISRQEFAFYAMLPLESLHETRILNGEYEGELKPLSEAIEATRRAHGLLRGQYWRRGQGPEEYEQLNRRYEAVLDTTLTRMYLEFGLDDLAGLAREDPEKLARLRERGRRAVFHKDEIRAALHDIVIRYEEDARRAAGAEAYSAAVTLLAAGLEGILLLKCLNSKAKAFRVASALPKNQRPSNDDPTRWTYETLIETCFRAGWLHPVSTPLAQYDPAGMAHALRRMRNYVHPGRRARERPWIDTEKDDYDDAEAIYVALASRFLRHDGEKAARTYLWDSPKLRNSGGCTANRSKTRTRWYSW